MADWNRWLYHPTDKSLRLLRYPDFVLSAEWPKHLEEGLPLIFHDGVLGVRHKGHRQWSWELSGQAARAEKTAAECIYVRARTHTTHTRA